MSRRISNRRAKDRKKRKQLRDRLKAKGVPQTEIERIIDARRDADLTNRHDGKYDTLRYDPDNDAGYYPDDAGYRPPNGDPLLRGAARAQGVTAKVVRRNETITKWQHRRLEDR